MVLDRNTGSLEHRKIFDVVDYLRAGDVLVFNDTRVIPARLYGSKVGTGGGLEILLLRRLSPNIWETLVRPGKRVNVGSKIELTDGSGINTVPDSSVNAEVIEIREGGIRLVKFTDESLLYKLGRLALPPYIHTPLENPDRYQTVYADVDGSIAAPTAGLHFTPGLIDRIQAQGVRCLFITLHVGLDTFQPVREDNPLDHHIHEEYGIISQEVATQLSQARAEGRRIICVGTTTVRLVEAAAQAGNPLNIKPFQGWVNLFILPGYDFQAVDGLITNFHLPRSTLLMLVSAFAGKGFITRAYQEAIAQKYRFYSFGDAMLIT